MKRTISVVLIVCLMLSFGLMNGFNSFVFAATESGTTEECTWSLSNGVLTIKGNGAMSSYCNDLPNSAVGPAPWGTSITKVVICDGVTNIGGQAFYNCKGLISIEIPDSVTKIGNSAFYDCISLNTISIPDSVTSIEGWAFYGCTGLSTITIPDSVETIEYDIFNACNGLTEITIPFLGEKLEYGNCLGYLFGAEYSEEHAEYVPSSLKKVVITKATRIGNSAFYGCAGITSVALADTVSSIGYNAFYGCSNLTSVIIPDLVGSIGEQAFYGCTSLESVSIGSGVKEIEKSAFEQTHFYNNADNWENGVLYIDEYLIGAEKSISGAYDIKEGTKCVAFSAFEGCTGLTSITIPDSMIAISDGVFKGCTGLKAVAIGNGVKTIGYEAFWGCAALTSIKIPNSVVDISNEAFYNCAALDLITIGTDITSIGFDAFRNTLFYNNAENWENGVLYIGDYLIEAENTFESTFSGECIVKTGTRLIADSAFARTKLTSVVIPDSVAFIGTGAFEYCSELKDVSLGNGVSVIGKYAFAYSRALAEITIPDQAVEIGDFAFCDCGGLTSVTVSNGLKTVGDYAFYKCYALENVYIKDLAAWCEIEFGNLESTPLYYAEKMYLNNALIEEVVIPENVVGLGDYAFYNRAHITSVSIPNSVTYIGAEAFRNCYNLTSITIPNSVTKIESGTFYNCTSLASVTIPDSVTSIGGGVFAECTSLEDITIPFVGGKEKTHFGYIFGASYDFENSNHVPASLKSVTVTNAKTIDSDAFRDCSGLTSITISDSVTSIGEGAFYGCSGLTEITVPFVGNDIDGTESTNLLYFFGDGKDAPDSLKTVVITKATTIGHSAFYGCTGLTEIRLPDSVTTIGDWAFHGCTGLTEIRVPNGVKTISGSAFSDCTALTSITFGKCSPTIGQRVFYNCDALENVYVEDLVAWCGVDFEVWESNPLYDAENLYINNVLTTNLVIPDGIETINAYAFCGCDGLESVFIPESVKSIEVSAFSDCPRLAQISLQGDLTYLSSAAFNDTAFYSDEENWEDGVLYLGQYLVAANDVIYGNYTVKSGTKLIANNAFYNGCYGISYNLTSIVLPTTVTYIGENAFAHCGRLRDVWYAGTTAQKEQISFGAEDNRLLFQSVTWHYESCAVDKSHAYDNNCDATCADCSYIREGVGHNYSSENAIAIENHQHKIPCSNGCGIDQIEDCVLGDWVHEECGDASVHVRSCICGREEEETCDFSKYVLSEGVSFHQITCATCGQVEKTEPCSFEKFVHIEETSSHQVVCDACGRVSEVEACTMRTLGIDLPDLGQVGEVSAYCIDGCGGTDRTKEILAGDINGDGGITIADVVLALRVLNGKLGITVVDTGAANVYTADGLTEAFGVNTADAIAILQYIIDR